VKKLNIDRIEKATQDIVKYSRALAWLSDEGCLVEQRDDAYGSVDANVNVTLEGAPKEANAVVASYARLHLPKSISDAIECCKNTIEISINIINSELTD